MKLELTALLFGLILLYSCAAKESQQALHPGDPEATPLAIKLYRNLHGLSGEKILLGHQDALAYGMGWKGGEFRGDINDVLGDHPAVYGWDLGHLGDELNIDSVPFTDMQVWARAVHEKGGMNTFSWHMRNYAMGGSSWDRDSCVEACLPGGDVHNLYLEKLDQAAAFFSGIINESGELIPVVFRPFHEMTGGWFWWGKGNCSTDQYKELFRFTVDYLRNEKDQHQLLIAYSSDKFKSAEQYMEFYPGDAYVDVMGFDDYHGVSSTETMGSTIQRLEILDSLSQAHGKIMAITETGQETIPNPKWFTEVVLPILDASESTRRAAWILFWRNGRPDHFYAPYPDHPVVPDFIEFMDHPRMTTLTETPDLYQ